MRRAVDGGIAASGSLLRRQLRLSAALCLIGAGACTSIVGIEDLHQEPRPGTPTEGGDGSGGSKTTEPNGGSATSPGGAPTDGGSPVAGSAQGGSSALGGAPGDGGTDPGPLAGAGGDGTQPGGPGTVHGSVVDFWNHKLANIPVQIGDELTSTDDKGEFTIENVPETYDVSFVTTREFNTVTYSFAWVYQGLTRRDPTLSVVYAALPQFGDVELAAQASPVAANQTISVAIGGPDGNNDLHGLDGTAYDPTVSWEGPKLPQTSAHGLYWQYDPVTELPTSYLAYDTTLVALSSAQPAKISLDLAKATVDYSPLQGTVTPRTDQGRENHLFLHFTSGATMNIVEDTAGPNTFSYQAPSLPGSTLTLVAAEYANDGSVAIVRADGLSPSSKPSVKIPTPVTITSPANGTVATAATKFACSKNAANGGPFVFEFENVDVNGPSQWLYVVTASNQITIPEVIGGGFSLQADNAFEWRVTTHGAFASTDAMAGPNGFIQPFETVFGDYNLSPYGPRQGDGAYTISAVRRVDTAK